MNKKTVRDIDLAGKRVLVRVDYNVPIQDGIVGDPLRIEASFPTIRYLLDQGCALVLMSHLGEPEGPDPKLSLRSVAVKVSELLGRTVGFVGDCVGAEVTSKAASLNPGDILLLENLRFHPEETANDETFAKQLAALADAYVDDAFAAAHRAHASIAGVPKHLPAVAGLLLEKEVDTIIQALEHPKRPLLAVIGGAKISSKIGVLDNLLEKVDAVLIGGAMANTFLAARGYQVGRSLVEADQYDTARTIEAHAKDKGVELFLPVDVVVTDDIKTATNVRIVPANQVGEQQVIADVGPQTIQQIDQLLSRQGTVIWNGPLGVTENPDFVKGSRLLADKLIASAAQTLIGGGDTAAFVDGAGLHDQFGLVSTGGGASLELMAGKRLPAVEALLDK